MTESPLERMTGSPRRTAGGLLGPGLPRRGRRPARRDRVRRDVGVRAAHRGRQAGARRCADKAALAAMAATEFAHFERLRDRLAELGADPFAAMAPFVAPFDAFHRTRRRRTGSRAWSRRTSGDGLAADFYREIAAFLDADTRDLIIVESLADAGQSTFVVDRVRAAIAADPRVGRPARAVGPPADGGGAVAGAAGGRRARRAHAPCWPAASTARAWTSPRSAGCSPGSPRTTRSGWRARPLGLTHVGHRSGADSIGRTAPLRRAGRRPPSPGRPRRRPARCGATSRCRACRRCRRPARRARCRADLPPMPQRIVSHSGMLSRSPGATSLPSSPMNGAADQCPQDGAEHGDRPFAR